MAACGVGPAIQEEGPRNREPLFSSKGIEADLVCQHFDNFRGRQDDLVPFFKSLSKSRDEQDALIVTGEEDSLLTQLRPQHLQDLNKLLCACIRKKDLVADSCPAGMVSRITGDADNGDTALHQDASGLQSLYALQANDDGIGFLTISTARFHCRSTLV